jgi:hypothetical protein
MRERGGRTLAQVFAAEADAVTAIRLRIVKGTTVHADESPAWNTLHASVAMQPINHQEGYSIDGACTIGAESYFSRLRRGELGHHHHIAGRYLVRYSSSDHSIELRSKEFLVSLVQEAAWHEDVRRVSTGERRGRTGHAVTTIGRLQRLLATRPGGASVHRMACGGDAWQPSSAIRIRARTPAGACYKTVCIRRSIEA